MILRIYGRRDGNEKIQTRLPDEQTEKVKIQGSKVYGTFRWNRKQDKGLDKKEVRGIFV